MKKEGLLLAAEAELARMEALESVDMLEKGLANFERTFPVEDVATVSRFQALKERLCLCFREENPILRKRER